MQIGYGVHYIYHQEPLDTKITEQMESIENIKKIYDYYTFNYSLLSASGFSQDMSVKVIRDDQEITRRKLDSDEDYSFSIIPFFPEEKLDLDKGIYVNSNMAYNYNIEMCIRDRVISRINYFMYSNDCIYNWIDSLDYCLEN